ncbi:diguanylate cyclase [[Clostridium] fimetarium]|uniref:Diguanylate cyclase n=1 Tax=[Clostridium] fimetarium TaxID=99656 RepID=A0A1I0RPG7_9FIRM|nr:diguanylate cyclase [[Clostridium] fimetarium]SEW42969.1 diguanylate cyclase [[Clostridium] fimetarium]
MFYQLFINACILIAFISISYFGFKDREVNINASYLTKIVIGLISGLLGISLMLNSVYVLPEVMIDFRYIPLLLTVVFCGFIPSITAGILMGTFRFLYFGASKSSTVAFVIIILIVLGFNIISKYVESKKKKWIYSIIYMVLLFSAGLFFVTGISILFFRILVIYYIGNTFVAYVIYQYTGYLVDMIKMNNKLKKEATKDFLTGLNNVREFDTSFRNLSRLTILKEEKLSYIYMDIDFFKKINDTYGHTAGDIVLQKTAEILKDTVRTFDVVSRNGGEEFSALLLDCSAEHAFRIAERIRKKIETYNFEISNDISIDITVSIGIASYPYTSMNIDSLIEDADKALYEAKRIGRNRVVMYKNKD